MRHRERLLTPKRDILLREAIRRWRMSPDGEHTGGQTLTTAWTGLGCATEYATVLEAGWMTYATRPNPGHLTWFRLTEAGAAIVERIMREEKNHDS